MQSIDYILKKYWGYSDFKPFQKEIIQAVLAKKEVLALMPTGGGKSLCFQLPTLLQEGICLVISPLIALMQDQIRQLKERNIPAVGVFSTMSHKEIDIALDNCVYGAMKFLYVSPERLKNELFLTRLQKMKIWLLVVDEAHCISEWGEDFRPAYRDIADIKPLLPHVHTLALTATATPQVQKDIVEQLKLQAAKIFQTSFIRHNLAYVVRQTPDIPSQLVNLLQKVAGSAIVYTNRRSKTNTIATLLNQKGIRATHYHAGLQAEVRLKHQKAWIENSQRVIVATNAFGMGIDKPDVRIVVHVDLPPSLEAYYQEAGRAGRDGKKAYAVVFYNKNSIDECEKNIQSTYPSLEKMRQVYQCLANYYQIAVGSHQMISYDFDIEDFAATYQIPSNLAGQAIKKLQEEGLIQYTDQFFSPAKVYISAPPKALYTFQVAHPQHDKLIQALAHIYGDGLFHDFSTISPKRLAKYLNASIEDLDSQLKGLQALGILHYIPQKNYAQITFITPRYAQERLPLSNKKFLQRKNKALDKWKAVIHYIEHLHRCRSLLLVEYLGQVAYERCKICDICLATSSKKKPASKNLEYYRTLILEQIQRGKYSIYHLVKKIDPDQAVLLSELIRQMVNEGTLAYDKTLHLYLKKPSR